LATDNEQLVLSISADTRQIQRQLKTLVGQTQANTKAIEQAFSGIDKAASSAFDGVAANSNKAFTTGANAAKQFERAMSSSRLQTANLAAQLNDIGVSLAGGQSPFLIALQQGTQITQALGSGVGARGAVGALAGAFTSLLNPVSLATIAIIGLGGAAIQYFTEMASGGEKSSAILKEQADLIDAVAKRWGGAVPALQAYVNALLNAKDAADLISASEGLANDQWLVARKNVEDLNVTFAALQQDLRAAGEDDETINALNTAFQELREKVEAGKATTADMESVTKALAATLYSEGIPSLADFNTGFTDLGRSILGATEQAMKFRQEALNALTVGKNGPALGTLSPLFSDGGQIRNGEQFTPRDVPTPENRPLIELEGLPGSGRGGGRKRDAETERLKREKEAVVDLIDQLEFEQSLIGKTDLERAEANALRRAGAAATDEQRAKISQLVEASYAERDALKANKEAMRELQDISRDVLEGIVSDLTDSKSAADILANALKRVGDRLLNSAFDGLFSGAVGGGKGGLFGGAIIPGILHDGGIVGKDGYGHGRAVSTSTFSGARRYHKGGIAGLKPDEVPAILQRGERIIPRGGQPSGTRGAVTIDARTTIHASGNATADAEMRRWAAKRDAELPATVIRVIKDAQKRRMI
jgi:hypothetical protein